MQPFTIDLNKTFPKLPNAPIVEAVIQWVAQPAHVLTQEDLLERLKSRFPDYSSESQHELQVEAEFQIKDSSTGFRHRSTWDGFRLTSHDSKNVCQFRPNGVAFSRLKPYEDWEKFTAEALPFWDAFVEWVSPAAIERIGVRFISQIDLESDNLAIYMEEPPSSLQSIGLNSESFFHKDTFQTPGYSYKINLNRAIRLTDPALTRKALIVDIDIMTTDTTMLGSMESRLRELRFIKNAVFFGFMKDAEAHFS